MRAQATASFIAGIVGVGVLFALIIFTRNFDLVEFFDRATDPDTAMAQVGAQEDRRAAAEAEEAHTAKSEAALQRLFESRESNVTVVVHGTVDRVFDDPGVATPTQKFVVRSGERTVMVEHDTGLAPMVPLGEGDTVRVRGEYEWTARGGRVLRTHADPDGRGAGGWIEFDGRRYE